MSFFQVSFPIIQSLEVLMTDFAGSCAESYSKHLMQGVAFLSAVLVQVFSLCVLMTAAHNRTEQSAGVGLNETYLLS